MSLRKLAFLDHWPSNSKVVAGFYVIVAASLLLFTIVFMNNSFQASTLQGLRLNGTSATSSLFSSPFSLFSGKANSPSATSDTGDKVLKKEGSVAEKISERNFTESANNASFMSFGEEGNASEGDEKASTFSEKEKQIIMSPESDSSGDAKNSSVESFGGEEAGHNEDGNTSDGDTKANPFSGDEKQVIMSPKNEHSEDTKNASLKSFGGDNMEKNSEGNVSMEAKNSSVSVSEKMVEESTEKVNSSAYDGGKIAGETHVGNTSEMVKDKSLSLGNSFNVNRSGSASGKCDIFNGRWVRDEGKPYYPGGSCPYIDRDFDCYKNGRPDVDFLKWRWQPYDCDIPSLNATDFLERLRGKRILFVGDSLNTNMWQSLVCILYHGVSNKKQVHEVSGRREFKIKGYYSFRYEDYNCSVDFVRSPYLVMESSVKGNNGPQETLRLDLLDETTQAYQGADVLVFNTGHWWTHEKTSKGADYYQEGDFVHPLLYVMEAYKKALTTWATWIDKEINIKRTRVFFRGYSVTHFSGRQWKSNGQCHETEPIFNESYLGKYPSKMKALEQVLLKMKTPVVYLNISKLSDYRKDGHPSIYREVHQTDLQSQDCSHWCLPGVPDTWNELLYASLVMDNRGSRTI